jgi:hypothetical protein
MVGLDDFNCAFGHAESLALHITGAEGEESGGGLEGDLSCVDGDGLFAGLYEDGAAVKCQARG